MKSNIIITNGLFCCWIWNIWKSLNLVSSTNFLLLWIQIIEKKCNIKNLGMSEKKYFLGSVSKKQVLMLLIWLFFPNGFVFVRQRRGPREAPQNYDHLLVVSYNLWRWNWSNSKHWKTIINALIFALTKIDNTGTIK